MTYRHYRSAMWRESDGRYYLKADENILKKWLPALTRYDFFTFRKNIEIEWTHEWPTEKFAGKNVIFFVRDPRDALYSRYRRENPDMSFTEFIAFPEPVSLLNKIDNWRLFTECWLSHDHCMIARFEDYKKDARGLLERIANYLDLEVEAGQLDKAATESTFAKAADAEGRYKIEHPEDKQLINRSGNPGNWKELAGERCVIADIEFKTGSLMARLGYETEGFGEVSGPVGYMPNTRLLSFFDKLIHMPRTEFAGDDETLFDYVMNFAKNIDKSMIEKAGLAGYEARLLIGSISEFIYKFSAESERRLGNLVEHGADRNSYFIELYRATRNARYLTKVSPGHLIGSIIKRHICI
jgi:hypothetical protein